jgi:hypothetical protein
VQASDDGFDLVGGQPDFFAAPLVRVGRIGGMKLAGDDADGNLTLALGEGVTAGVEMRAERPTALASFGL